MTGDNRKIATILAADVVGYSRLMEDDEEATLAALKITRNIFKRLVGQFGGLEFGSVGDSMMAQFPSAVNAVQCAQNIQKAVAIENESRHDDRHLALRMGINLGDVIEEEGNLYGDGVNMAARIQDLASPGNILITGSVYEHVANKIKAGFEYSGQRYVKNINHPVEVYAVLADSHKRPFRRISELRKLLANHPAIVLLSVTVITVVLVLFVVWNYNIQAPQSTATENQMAVLPFENLSGDSSDDWLGLGISEDILNLLAQIKDLRVVARTSSFQPRLQDLDVREIGNQLSARYVLEGSVRRDGERIMIVAQLNDAQTGTHLWSERYERNTSDVLAIQPEIAERVVKALKLELSVDFSQDPLKRPTENIDAWNYYLQAKSFLEKTQSEKSLQDAEKFFRRSLEFDPEFGLAYAGICSTLIHQMELQHVDTLHEAEKACEGSMQYAPDSYHTHLAMGELYKLKGETGDALREFEWVVKNTNDDIDARLGIAYIYANSGDKDAADRAFRDAIQISPGYSLAYRAYGAFLLFNKGLPEAAIEIYQRLIELEPANMPAYNNLGAAYLFAGNFEQAAEALRKVIAQEPNALGYTNFGIVYYYLGRYSDAATMYSHAIELLPDDYTLRGTLGDALIQMPDKQEDARKAYQQARELTEEQLEINKNQGDVLAAMAHYCAMLDDMGCAKTSIEKALQLSGTDPYTHYFAALVNLYAGNKAQALVHMAKAENMGYSSKLLNADPLLAPLRNNGRLSAKTPERVD